jgi:hypothetical protein
MKYCSNRRFGNHYCFESLKQPPRAFSKHLLNKKKKETEKARVHEAEFSACLSSYEEKAITIRDTVSFSVRTRNPQSEWQLAGKGSGLAAQSLARALNLAEIPNGPCAVAEG